MDRLEVQDAQAQKAQGAQALLDHLVTQGQLKKNEKGDWELVGGADRGGF